MVVALAGWIASVLAFVYVVFGIGLALDFIRTETTAADPLAGKLAMSALIIVIGPALFLSFAVLGAWGLLMGQAAEDDVSG